MKLGIFDSGIGGEAIAISLRATFPKATIVSINDREHLPYGDKTRQQIIELTDKAIQPLLQATCDIIVIACNSATANAIEELRNRYPNQSFIGIEPMVKAAATITKTNKIAVCATPATLTSARYHSLVETYAPNMIVIEPDCSNWAYMIENNKINHQQIERTVDSICNQGADVIVLGCTHYHWIKEFITVCANGRARVLEPSEAIGRRVLSLLKED